MRFLSFLLLTLAIGSTVFALEGKVLTENNRLFAAKGELIRINLGENDGVLKGDVLRIFKRDSGTGKILGECVVVRTDRTSAVCEIIKSGQEVESGDLVRVDRVDFLDEKLGRFVIYLLKNILEPYPPEKIVSVYLRGIFDTENRLTRFSQSFTEEFKNVVFQKRSIRLVEEDEAVKLKQKVHYPDRYIKIGTDFFYPEEVKELRRVMERANIDVVILGSYMVDKENISLSAYYIDKNFGGKRVVGLFPASNYWDRIKEVIEPYTPLKPVVAHEVKLSLRKVHFFPTSREQIELAKKEAEGDIEFRNTILAKKVKFDRISPENIVVLLNGKSVKIKEGEEVSLFMEDGTHNLSVSYQPAFYSGSELMYLSKRRITGEISLVLKDTGNKYPICVDLILGPGLSKDDVVFDVFRRSEVLQKKVKGIELRRKEMGPIFVYTD